MLKFNTTFYTITSRCTSRLLRRINLSFSTNSTVAITIPVNTVKSNHQREATALNISINHDQHVEFNELKKRICSICKVEPPLLTAIQNSQNVNVLLQDINTSALDKNVVAQIKEIIDAWINVNDKLTSNSKAESSVNDKIEVPKIGSTESEVETNIDLESYSDLSTKEVIKELKKLTAAKTRNIHLLKCFFHNILKNNVTLKVEQCSNLLYSMSVLNYSDERLLRKIFHDLMITDNIDAFMIAPILRSMASIRYKNKMFLNHMCNTIINMKENFKAKTIANILLSLAILGYQSELVNKIIEQHKENLTLTKIGSSDWLDLVWSLIIFKRANISHVESVLDRKFISELKEHDLKLKKSHHLKLLNINGYAQYALKDYKGPLLDHNITPCITNKRSQQKELQIIALENALKNMLPSSSQFKMNVNTKMGFLLDAEYYMDANFNVININTNKDINVTKIGIIMSDYYDKCLGTQDFNGIFKLYTYLLTCNNYALICIPYEHFDFEDNLEKHISYLKRRMWKICKRDT